MIESDNSWEKHWGRGYDLETKERMLKPLFEELDEAGKLGDVIVDVGSGSWSVLRNLPFFANKKEIHVDIATEDDASSREAHVKFDVEKIDQPDSLAYRKALVRVSDFLNIDPRIETNKERADTIVFSEILNYVDYEKVIAGFSEYIKPGGSIIIINMPGRGVRALFSGEGLKDNNELYSFLEEHGFNIEYKILPWRTSVDVDDRESTTEMIVLVAQKSDGSSLKQN